MATLTGPSRPPISGGTPDSLVILFHGIGSDGEDLIRLADVFAETLPDTAFHSPDAPDRFEEAPMGYQWFPRRALAKDGEAARVESTVNAFIDELLAEYGLDESRCVLVGFSQGAIVSLHVAPRRDKPVAGVVAFSGAMPTAATLQDELRCSPPCLLIHGAEDPVLPPSETETAAQYLEQAGVPVSKEILPGLGHAIDQRGLDMALQFMQGVLYASKPGD